MEEGDWNLREGGDVRIGNPGPGGPPGIPKGGGGMEPGRPGKQDDPYFDHCFWALGGREDIPGKPKGGGGKGCPTPPC